MTIYPELVHISNTPRVPYVSPLRRGIPHTLALLSTLTFAFCLTPTHALQTAPASASPIHGAQLFVDTGCSHCHGPAGSGGDRGPDLKNITHRMTAQKMTTQIHDGGQSMPPFGDVLTPQDVTDLVAYLRAKRKPPVPPPSTKEPFPLLPHHRPDWQGTTSFIHLKSTI